MPSSRSILALETSCDETAAAILTGFDRALTHEIFSQAQIHATFGGVVPEVASRNHLQSLPWILDRVLDAARIKISDLDAVAATTGPGLAAALLVGASTAKGLAIGTGLPFIAVNHIEGHLLSPFFGNADVPPHTALIVSGGHTLLFDVERFRRYQLLGRTFDDAAGEAFDKVAKLLGLGYPGGAEIDRLALEGNPQRFTFPRAMMDSGDCHFSFSGLKTSVRVFLERGFAEKDLPDICASFQLAIVEVLVAKALRAARLRKRNIIAISGGVSANTALRHHATEQALQEGISLRFAPEGLLTDNALMIAFAAAHHLAAGQTNPYSHEIAPNFDEAALCA